MSHYPAIEGKFQEIRERLEDTNAFAAFYADEKSAKAMEQAENFNELLLEIADLQNKIDAEKESLSFVHKSGECAYSEMVKLQQELDKINNEIDRWLEEFIGEDAFETSDDELEPEQYPTEQKFQHESARQEVTKVLVAEVREFAEGKIREGAASDQEIVAAMDGTLLMKLTDSQLGRGLAEARGRSIKPAATRSRGQRALKFKTK